MSGRTRDHSGSQHNLSSALAEAQNIVEAARKRASDLQLEADKTYKAAYKQGYSEGFQQGRQDCTETALQLVTDTVTLDEQLSEAAAELALSICAFVIGEYVKANPDTVKAIALQALREASIGESASVLVHPEDESLLNKSIDALRQATGNMSIVIKAEPSIARGGCLIRTRFGEVDATIETLVNSVATRLGISRNGK